jgi:hypothetical protein
MKLPNADKALVPREKITGYLLNPEHPDGAGKAHFFIAFGFNAGDWQVVAESLQQLADRNEVGQTVESVHGIKYVFRRKD